MHRLRIETDDHAFRSDLEAARIKGLDISLRLEASAGHELLLFSIEVTKAAIPLLVKWLFDRVVKQKRGHTTVDSVQVPHTIEQLNILIVNSEVVQKPQRAPTKKEHKPGVHRGPPRRSKR